MHLFHTQTRTHAYMQTASIAPHVPLHTPPSFPRSLLQVSSAWPRQQQSATSGCIKQRTPLLYISPPCKQQSSLHSLLIPLILPSSLTCPPPHTPLTPSLAAVSIVCFASATATSESTRLVAYLPASPPWDGNNAAIASWHSSLAASREGRKWRDEA